MLRRQDSNLRPSADGYDPNELSIQKQKGTKKPAEAGFLLVAEAGLEPTTFGL